MDTPPGPPRLGHPSETIWLVGVLCALLLVLVPDAAGALCSALSGGHGKLVSLSAMGRVLVGLAKHPDRPAGAWPAAAGLRFGAATFWAVLGLIVLVAVVPAALGLRLLHGQGSGRWRGFASPAGVARVASLRAAQQKARQTRPALVAELPQVLGRPRLSRLRTEDVGYRLGVTREPRGLRLVANWEVNVRVVAPPGEGKTERFMRPIGGSHPGPLFATSTKPDLYEGLASMREAGGRPVWALDPDGLVPGATPVRWSPVEGCCSTRTAERRAGALVAAGADTSDVRSGEFFRSSAKTVLAALLHAAALGDRPMSSVLAWAADPSDPTPVQLLNRLGSSRVDWGARLSRHTTGAEATTSGVMRTLDVALGCFQHDDVADLCSPAPGEGFDFKDLLEHNGSVFALGKERPGGVGPLVTAFAEELLFVAEHEAARRPARRLDPPLMFLLDEVAGIAPLPSLPQMVADGRGRGVVTIYVLQSDSQAELRWGREGAATLRNATTAMCVLGGLKDAEDLHELSRLCGTEKVLRHTSSRDGRGAGQSISATFVDEPVLDEAAIRTLDDGVALVLWAKLPPMLVYMPGSWEGPDAKAAASAVAVARQRNDAARAASPIGR